MNALPDAFLVNIILHGGPAEGLTPGMPPFAAYLGAVFAVAAATAWRALTRPAKKGAVHVSDRDRSHAV